MLKTSFTLISKRSLTHDVYELIYSCLDLMRDLPKPGQYAMFQLAPWLNRSYSIASFTIDTFTLVIKRIGDGKWSPMICDAEVGQVFSGMLPLGHFVLRDTKVPKCFIGTGTGFAPLYCQMLGHSLSEDKTDNVTFIFGVRNFADSFYESEISLLGRDFENFEYTQYFSRESDFSSITPTMYPTCQISWYVTDWIIPEHIDLYQEFYICGSPAMVKSAREKFETLWVESDRVLWEQF